VLRGEVLVPGAAEGDVLVLDEPISFWGGVDPGSGTIIDVRHPQCGANLRGRVLVLPGTKGSTAGPGALLETMFAGNGPAAILLTQPDLMCVVAMTALEALGGTAAPVLALASGDHAPFDPGSRWRVAGDRATRIDFSPS
jgi:predicted aconitase with swiveling domain